MLAFVFWHAASPGSDPAEYVARLAEFHAALAQGRPAGFLFSTAVRQDAVPWLTGATPVFEDWYHVVDSAALDPLDEAAVSAKRRQAHDRVATLSGPGAGGLYRRCVGETERGTARHALWFDKPRGEPRDAWLERLEPAVTASGGELWSRQMVLSPAPEWCLRAPVPVEIDVDVLHRATLETVVPATPG